MSSKRFLPILLILSMIACCIEVDISVPSFPEMVDYFSSTQTIIQFTIGLNFLGFCIGASIFGPLSDAWGRKKVMIIGNAVMTLGALGCVMSHNMTMLLAARFIQGIGAATSVVVATVMITDTYNEQESAKLIGLMNAIFTTLMSIAPLIGSVILSKMGWQGNYAVVATLSLVSWICMLIWLPETSQSRRPVNMGRIIMDYKSLLLNKAYRRTSVVPSLLYALFLSYISSAPFLYISTFGLTNAAYAIHQAIIVASFAITSMFFGPLNKKWGDQRCITIGFISTLIGMTGLVMSGIISQYYLFTLSMMCFCFGFAILYPILFTQSLNVLPDLKGAASSLNMSARALIIFIVVGVTSWLHTTPLSLSVVLWLPFALILILMSQSRHNTCRFTHNPDKVINDKQI